jgi:hypothetical protein
MRVLAGRDNRLLIAGFFLSKLPFESQTRAASRNVFNQANREHAHWPPMHSEPALDMQLNGEVVKLHSFSLLLGSQSCTNNATPS